MSDSYMAFIYVALAFLAVDGVITMGFVTNMVTFLHTTGQGPFPITTSDGPLLFYAEPEHPRLIGNQGHTTNGAGGTALILIGLGGALALWLESRSRRNTGRSSVWFITWSIMTVLSLLLTLTALIWTFVVTAQTANQSIDMAHLRTLLPDPNGATLPYDLLTWTPENWYKAVLQQIDFVNQGDRDLIQRNYNLMVGWRWNLIPLFLLGLLLVVLVALENLRVRRSRGLYAATGRNFEAKEIAHDSTLA